MCVRKKTLKKDFQVCSKWVNGGATYQGVEYREEWVWEWGLSDYGILSSFLHRLTVKCLLSNHLGLLSRKLDMSLELGKTKCGDPRDRADQRKVMGQIRQWTMQPGL